MDSMTLNFKLPGEDEIALNLLSGGASPYAALSFMKMWEESAKYLTFHDAKDEDFKAWKDSFLYFLKKVTYASSGKQLVIKSPVHIGRLNILLRIFPHAKFVFIHRKPQDVIQSSIHMANAYFPYCYLSTPGREQIISYIFNQYDQLYNHYLSERDSIVPVSLSEISFSRLETYPVSTCSQIYKDLGLSDFDDRVCHSIKSYCQEELKNFKKNVFQPMSDELKALIEIKCENIDSAFKMLE